jgi:hypothetical protein
VVGIACHLMWMMMVKVFCEQSGELEKGEDDGN